MKVVILIEKTKYLVTEGYKMLIANQTVYYPEFVAHIWKRNLYEKLIPKLKNVNRETVAQGFAGEAFIIGTILKGHKPIGRIERTKNVKMEDSDYGYIRIIIEW